MTYSTLLQIKNDAIILEYLIGTTELIASSEKGYKEFRDDKGKVFRATDYDSRLKKRIQVPIRDAAEKASKTAKQVAENTGAIADYAKSSFTLSAQFIKESLTNSEFRRRVGLGAGMPAAKLISSCLEKLKLTGLSEKVDEWIAKGTKELADQYGDDKNPFAQAIRKGDGIAPPKDATLKDKLEFYAAKHTIYMEVLKKPEKYNATKETVAKAAASFVPIAVTMGLTLGFGVGIPLLAGEGIASVLTSFALGEAVDVATQKGLDKLNVENIWVRMGVGILAGVASGGIVTAASKKMAATAVNKVAAKKMAEEAERVAKEAEVEAERLAKEIFEKAEADRIAKEAEEEAERLAKEVADKIAKEKAEKEILEKAEADRIAKASQEKAQKAATEEGVKNALEKASNIKPLPFVSSKGLKELGGEEDLLGRMLERYPDKADQINQVRQRFTEVYEMCKELGGDVDSLRSVIMSIRNMDEVITQKGSVQGATDMINKAIASLNGFDRKPIIVNGSEEVESLAQKHGYTEVFRGVTNHGEDFLHGDMYHGMGMLGNGSYFANKGEVIDGSISVNGSPLMGDYTGYRLARSYAQSGTNKVTDSSFDTSFLIYAAYPPNTKEVNIGRLRGVQGKLLEMVSVEKSDEWPAIASVRKDADALELAKMHLAITTLAHDPGRLAASMGFDQIHVPVGSIPDMPCDYKVVLNRAKLVVADKNFYSELL